MVQKRRASELGVKGGVGGFVEAARTPCRGKSMFHSRKVHTCMTCPLPREWSIGRGLGTGQRIKLEMYLERPSKPCCCSVRLEKGEMRGGGQTVSNGAVLVSERRGDLNCGGASHSRESTGPKIRAYGIEATVPGTGERGEERSS